MPCDNLLLTREKKYFSRILYTPLRLIQFFFFFLKKLDLFQYSEMLITIMIKAELIHNITELTLVWNCIHMYDML